LKVDSLSIESVCAGSEFHVDVAESKLLVMLDGLAKRFVLEECKVLGGW